MRDHPELPEAGNSGLPYFGSLLLFRNDRLGAFAATEVGNVTLSVAGLVVDNAYVALRGAATDIRRRLRANLLV